MYVIFSGRSVTACMKVELFWRPSVLASSKCAISCDKQSFWAFQKCISFLRFFRKGMYGNAGTFLSCFAGISLVFVAFPTKVSLFLPCSHKHVVARIVFSENLWSLPSDATPILEPSELTLVVAAPLAKCGMKERMNITELRKRMSRNNTPKLQVDPSIDTNQKYHGHRAAYKQPYTSQFYTVKF